MTRSLPTTHPTHAAIAVHAPHLLDRYHAARPAAADTVGRRLRAALARERLTAAGNPAHTYGFDRVEYHHAGADDPADLLTTITSPGVDGFATELRNAVDNLAIALARTPPALTGDDPDSAALTAERLAVAGHNLHPCGRTRLGWDTTDVLTHDLEAGPTHIRLLAVRHDAHHGDDLADQLDLPAAPPGYRTQPVHAWQHDLLTRRHPELFADGALRHLDGSLDAVPTAALRTLLLPGTGRYLKLSLDIQVTSTRRSISVASTHNGPRISRLLHTLLADDPDGHRILLLAETGGAAVPATGRDLSAIARDGLTGRLAPDEHALPGGALPATDPTTGRTLLAGLVDQAGGNPAAWLDAYARLLLPPLLRLATHGVGFEAHLQNCLPTFRAGHPHRLALRDFAGLRLHPGRLAAAGHTVDLWSGSVIATDNPADLLAKLGYTALQAHLGELVIRLGQSHALDENAAWRIVRAVIDETYDRHGPDHAALTAPTMPHKALVRMRLAGAGDLYIPVRNPLHEAR